MKKREFIFISFSFFLLSLLVGIASAEIVTTTASPIGISPLSPITVTGVTYDENAVERLEGSNVSVVCHHGDQITEVTTVSGEFARYSAIFPNTDSNHLCVEGDNVVITATNGDLLGVVEGVIGEDMDLLLIHVPMTPEFGFYMAILTLVSSIGMFFLIRKT